MQKEAGINEQTNNYILWGRLYGDFQTGLKFQLVKPS